MTKAIGVATATANAARYQCLRPIGQLLPQSIRAAIVMAIDVLSESRHGRRERARGRGFIPFLKCRDYSTRIFLALS
jgi:hypothetical protein